MYDTNPFIIQIDDDEDDLEMMASSLKQHGVRTRTFTSGVNALACFDQMGVLAELPSLIILDYNMPIMNGIETLKKIKSLKSIKHIPVVIYSTVINPLFECTARQNGVFAFTVKATSLADFELNVACFAAIAHSSTEINSRCSELA
jgi:CheY-like chemotaxis protein